MSLPTLEEVDGRLSELLDAFEPGEITSRQRAEDLVACALTMYGGALRRVRELLDIHGAGDHLAVWIQHEPLGGLLALHRADTPAPPPVEAEDVRRAAGSIENILDELDTAPIAVRERSVAMLTVVTELHGVGLAQLVGAVDGRLRPPAAVLAGIGDDDLVASLLLVHGLHPEPLETRVRRTLEDLRRLSGPAASVELLTVDGTGAHLRIDGVNPGDAYRLRLNVERTIAERVPDLPALHIDGGNEPTPATSVFIPLESVTVRRTGSPSTVDATP